MCKVPHYWIVVGWSEGKEFSESVGRIDGWEVSSAHDLPKALLVCICVFWMKAEKNAER